MCYFGFVLSLKFTVPILAKCSFSLAIHLLISDIGLDLICWPPQVFSLRSLVLGLGSYSLSLNQLWTCDQDLG